MKSTLPTVLKGSSVLMCLAGVPVDNATSEVYSLDKDRKSGIIKSPPSPHMDPLKAN